MKEIMEQNLDNTVNEIYFDSDCNLCNFAVNSASVDFVRTPLKNSQYSDSDYIVVRYNGELTSGFDGIVTISKNSVALFPLIPLVLFMKFSHTGNFVYRIVSAKRGSIFTQFVFGFFLRFSRVIP